ncbi:Ran-binding-domain-containing protein [Lepidopterella palustris CBS 459.81]|uniref:Ran-binding-domain-containing protein n=1 Tax=Lepidopterella palustris CBS 459.81 TaxID=1314670 RepID=A0A8E2E0U8_9PEZI|nr:Ran-binding-domain-containing protein [Lepidopterella palustris CBS 459.81]
MDAILSKVTQQAMNYAIRSGVTVMSGFAIQQCTRLIKTAKGSEKEELASLQLRLEGKIRIISPAIDMIELIAARGNTSLESAVSLTKALRWDIQSLGVRLSRAVGEEELTRRGSSKAKSHAQNELELKLIISDIKKLLNRIEDAVPLISLAITTSGVSLSTTLPVTVSPSRLLQASTFLTAGDTQYSFMPNRPQQIGPTFTLSMYMLFSGHAYRPHDEEGARETTWKEVTHKTRLMLLRVPLDKVNEYPSQDGAPPNYRKRSQANGDNGEFHQPDIPAEGKAHEFAYQLLVVEDLDDDRVHTFEDDEIQPGPYEGVKQAGIREIIPVHEISKIFYADTGKILNIGTEGETNNPILLLKRDVNAPPPRRMMERQTAEPDWYHEQAPSDEYTVGMPSDDDEQTQLDEQIRRESSATLAAEASQNQEQSEHHHWRFPPNLDPEWLAFEVYTEEPPSDSDIDESEPDIYLDTSAANTLSNREQSSRSDPLDPSITARISNLSLHTPTPSATPTPSTTQLTLSPVKHTTPLPQYTPPPPPDLPAIKTSLSLLEMLIRLTALQQFQQSSHLAIPDELLTFFLSESSTVGSGGNSEIRRRVRRDARRRVGFDPYDESPIKRRGEEYLEHAQERERDASRYGDHSPERYSYEDGEEYDYNEYSHDPHNNTRSSRSRTGTPFRSSPFVPPSLPLSSPLGSPLGTPLSPVSSSPGVGSDIPLLSRESHKSRKIGSPLLRSSISSPSPLLRRATARTQPQSQSQNQNKMPFREPQTAPPTSSSPRLGQGFGVGLGMGMGMGMGGSPKRVQGVGPMAPETPPSSGGR